MSYAKMTQTSLVGVHIVEDRLEETSPGELSINYGYLVEITSTTLSPGRPALRDRQVFQGTAIQSR